MSDKEMDNESVDSCSSLPWTPPEKEKHPSSTSDMADEEGIHDKKLQTFEEIVEYCPEDCLVVSEIQDILEIVRVQNKPLSIQQVCKLEEKTNVLKLQYEKEKLQLQKQQQQMENSNFQKKDVLLEIEEGAALYGVLLATNECKAFFMPPLPSVLQDHSQFLCLSSFAKGHVFQYLSCFTRLDFETWFSQAPDKIMAFQFLPRRFLSTTSVECVLKLLQNIHQNETLEIWTEQCTRGLINILIANVRRYWCAIPESVVEDMGHRVLQLFLQSIPFIKQISEMFLKNDSLLYKQAVDLLMCDFDKDKKSQKQRALVCMIKTFVSKWSTECSSFRLSENEHDTNSHAYNTDDRNHMFQNHETMGALAVCLVYFFIKVKQVHQQHKTKGHAIAALDCFLDSFWDEVCKYRTEIRDEQEQETRTAVQKMIVDDSHDVDDSQQTTTTTIIRSASHSDAPIRSEIDCPVDEKQKTVDEQSFDSLAVLLGDVKTISLTNEEDDGRNDSDDEDEDVMMCNSPTIIHYQDKKHNTTTKKNMKLEFYDEHGNELECMNVMNEKEDKEENDDDDDVQEPDAKRRRRFIDDLKDIRSPSPRRRVHGNDGGVTDKLSMSVYGDRRALPNEREWTVESIRRVFSTRNDIATFMMQQLSHTTSLNDAISLLPSLFFPVFRHGGFSLNKQQWTSLCRGNGRLLCFAPYEWQEEIHLAICKLIRCVACFKKTLCYQTEPFDCQGRECNSWECRACYETYKNKVKRKECVACACRFPMFVEDWNTET